MIYTGINRICKLKGEKIGEERGRLHVAINLLDVLDDATIGTWTK